MSRGCAFRNLGIQVWIQVKNHGHNPLRQSCIIPVLLNREAIPARSRLLPSIGLMTDLLVGRHHVTEWHRLVASQCCRSLRGRG